MPTRKIILVICLSLALSMGALAGWQIAREQTKPSRSVHQAIVRGEDHLLATLNDVSSYQRLILDFLNRKFKLNPRFSASVTPISLTSDASQAEYDAFARIGYPNKLVNSLPAPAALEPVDYMLMTAANCDHIAPPKDFGSIMQQNIQAGGYNLTHALLSEVFMTENDCHIPADIAAPDQIVERVAALVSDPSSSSDLRYEAIALLFFTGHRELVRPAWIPWIIHQQRADGGWNRDGGMGASSDHPTVLALWALLEYANPQASPEPIILRPKS